jgi:hypothetical protein
MQFLMPEFDQRLESSAALAVSREAREARTRIAPPMTPISLMEYDNPARGATCYLMVRSICRWLVSVPTHTALLCVSFHPLVCPEPFRLH